MVRARFLVLPALWPVLLLALLPGRAGGEASPAELTQRYTQEMAEVVQRRGVRPAFDQLAAFFADRLDASAGERTFADKTGNCRLSWVDHLLRHPLEAPIEAERFTRELHEAASDPDGYEHLIAMIGEKLDAPWQPPAPRERRAVDARSALDALIAALTEARAAWEAAIAPLSAEEMAELRASLLPMTTHARTAGHRFAEREQGRRVADLLEKMDRRALTGAAAALAPLTEPAFLAALAAGPWPQGGQAVPGVEGRIVQRLETPAGAILVGGTGPNRYDLDALRDVAAVIDLGGDDVYLEGTVGPDRPVLVIIDLGGNDQFRGSKPGIQGGAVLGVSLLVSAAGDDVYEAGDVAQGSALGGVGVLIDLAGNDRYVGDKRVQGHALAGIGVLIDRAGDDQYRAALLAQGCGGPLGLGLLEDTAGNDHFYAGGKYPGPYDDTPGFGGWSQGVGVGPRGVANGGIGVLLAGGGDNAYEYDYFSHGGGYWFAAGFARDFAGNDQRHGATRTNFDGSERTEPRFVRWGTGYGCHYAVGFVLDDAGDDSYGGDFAAIAFAWDVGIAGILDFAGHDSYGHAAAAGPAQAHNAGVSFLFDAAGDDRYFGEGLGVANPVVDYHPQDQAGGNFTLFLDAAGQDQYPPGLEPRSEQQRGWAGGIFIDR